MSLFEALEHVKSKRPTASPNPGFLCQLQNFEKSLRGTYYLATYLSYLIDFYFTLLSIFSHSENVDVEI